MPFGKVQHLRAAILVWHALHQQSLLVTSFCHHPAPWCAFFLAVSTARHSMAGRLQLSGFAAVTMRRQITALAFRHGINRAHYDGFPLQSQTPLTSHVRTKSLPSPQPAATVRRSRGMRPLSVSLDGVTRPAVCLHCLTACGTGTDCLVCCR